MSYQVNAELPDHIRGVLPDAAQTRFRMTANNVLAKKGSDKTAIRQAWLVVKSDWEKGSEGCWVRKDAAPAPTSSSSSIQGATHLNRFLSGCKKKKNKHSLEKAVPRTLYICRYVQNAQDIIDWAKSQGFKTTLKPTDLHVTVIHSSKAVDWMAMGQADDDDEDDTVDGTLTVAPGGPRLIEPLGDKGAVVLLFASQDLDERNAELRAAGASSDYEGYQSHITITWDATGVDLSTVKPYQGPIVLGPEVFAEIDNNWSDNITEKCLYSLQSAGLITKAGWGSVKDHGSGNPYHDASDGKFTSGPGAGGAAHFTAHTAGKVAAALAVDHTFSRLHDWFTNSKVDGNASTSDHVKAVDAKLAVPKTQHSVAATVAKEVVHALIVLGIEALTVTALGKVAKVLMPFLSGPVKQTATAAASVVLGRIARQIPIGTAVKTMGAALGFITTHRLKGALVKAEITTDDLVQFQISRLQEVLKDLDPSDLAVQRAEAFLQSTDPVMLKNILNDLEDAGLTGIDQTIADHAMDARVVKVDQSLGLVMGFAIICKQDGSDYFDLNIDRDTGERVPEHITETAMLKAATSFMQSARVAKEMHGGDSRGTVVFAFPLTTDIAKALGIQTKTTGLLIAMKPDAAMFAKYLSKELTGFSIGGSRLKVENVNTEVQ